MSESRTELLAWLNDLLQINYTKVEQVGTGAAHCQIIDSIFNDVPMIKVKFEAKHQYEYVQNFKVLQTTFSQHKIDKVVPVERLVLCKFQDNLEFLQWMKKYWDTYYPGGSYDAPSRRKAKSSAVGARKPPASPAPHSMKKTLSSSSVDRPAPKGLKTNTSSRVAASNQSNGNGNGSGAASGGGVSNGVDPKIVDELTTKLSENKVLLDGLEKERDFYFGKLRDIEILTQQHVESVASGEPNDTGALLKSIQNILYSTEDGFEVPVEGAAAPTEGAEDETF